MCCTEYSGTWRSGFGDSLRLQHQNQAAERVIYRSESGPGRATAWERQTFFAKDFVWGIPGRIPLAGPNKR